MASPLSIFRKYQYVALVALGLLAIVSFVVLPPIDDYLRGSRLGGTNVSREVVFTWSEGKVRESDLLKMELSHNLAMNFLEAVATETRRRKGEPKAMPLPRAGNRQGVVENMLLAEKATRLGMIVSDEAIGDYLVRYSDQLLTDADFAELLRSTAGDRLTVSMLYNQLRTELLAINMKQIALSPLGVPSPDSSWQHFQQLNQRVVLEMLPLPVADFVAQVEAQPSEAELQELYNQYKEQFRNPYSPEPGFRRLPQMNFSYFKLDFDRFLEQEMEKITDEQIQAEYELGLKTGDYRRPALPPAQPAPPGDAAPEDAPSDTQPPAQPAAETPASDATPSSEPAPQVPAEPATDAPATEEPATEEPATEEPATEEPATEEPSAEGPPGEQPAPETPATDEPSAAEENPAVDDEPTEPEADSCGQGQQPAASDEPDDGLELVPAIEPPAEPDATPQPDAGSESDPADEQAVEEQAVEEQPAAEQPAEQPAAEAAAPGESAEATPSEPAPSEPAPSDPAPTDPAAGEAAPMEDIPLEQVRDDIVRKLARPLAQERADAVRKKVKAELDRYFRERVIWQQKQQLLKEPTDPPPPPNYEQMAEELLLTYGSTGLVDIFAVENTELGQTSKFVRTSTGIGMVSFAEVGFDPEVPPYRMRDIGAAVEAQVDYMYWKTETKEEFIPEFADIKTEVQEAWKQIEARKLAEKQAQQLREQAAGASGSLSERLPDRASAVFQTNEFSWLTRGNVGFSFSQTPRISDVEGVDRADADFMREVFRMKPDEVGVVANAPQTVVYVARVVRRSPAEDVLRQRFLQEFHSGAMAQIQPMVQQDYVAYYQSWYQQLEDELNVRWQQLP